MLIRRPPDIPSSEITPESRYLNRRAFIKTAAGAAAVLGLRLAADTVMSLTDVDAVYQDWGTPRQRPLRTLTLEQAEALLAEGGLGAGSMRPKVEAAVGFVSGGGWRAVIAHLGDGAAALRGETGTTIRRELA